MANLNYSRGLNSPVRDVENIDFSVLRRHNRQTFSVPDSVKSTTTVAHPQTGPYSNCYSEWLDSINTNSNTHTEQRKESNFCYILNAPTSPATKICDAPLTYLNQGQSYEIKMQCFENSRKYSSLWSTIKIVFFDRRLQYTEKEQLNFWRQSRPGERILDIDIPMSTGVSDIKIESQQLNVISFSWCPSQQTGISIRVNSISTEFTQRKHGGEKGVPFQIQIDTKDFEDSLPLHRAGCQIKVFKPKGADKKVKTDREKMNRQSDIERRFYRISECQTYLEDIPLDGLSDSVEGSECSTPRDLLPLSAETNINSVDLAHLVDGRPNNIFTKNTDCFNASSTRSFCCKDFSPKLQAVDEIESFSDSIDIITSAASPQQVIHWLRLHHFEQYCNAFNNFSGADLMRLNRDDLVEICGLADGIRLNNALQDRYIRPKLKLFIHHDPLSLSDGATDSLSSPSSGHWSCNSSPEHSSAASAVFTSADENTEKLPSPPIRLPSIETAICFNSQRNRKRPTTSQCSNFEEGSSPLKKIRLGDHDKDKIYRAVYLDKLSVASLRDELAYIGCLNPVQLQDLTLINSAGIHIMVTDTVLQHLQDQSCYNLQLTKDYASGLYDATLVTDSTS